MTCWRYSRRTIRSNSSSFRRDCGELFTAENGAERFVVCPAVGRRQSVKRVSQSDQFIRHIADNSM